MQGACGSEFAQHEPYKVKILREVHHELKLTERDGIRGCRLIYKPFQVNVEQMK